MVKVAPEKPRNYIKFLGTAGARFVMIRQLRASAGIWVNAEGTNVLIDPGPGSIVRCATSRPRLDPSALDGIIVTHRHLDHCGDINVMIEGMTEGGFKKQGSVYCPRDCLSDDPVILKYVLDLPESITILKPRRKYATGNFIFFTSMPHKHPVETYGLKFTIQKTRFALLTDTGLFDDLSTFYRSDILIIAVVFLKPHPGVDHLSLPDVRTVVREVRPKKVILTHFGMSMLKARPHIQAQKLTQELGLPVEAAYDGMTLAV